MLYERVAKGPVSAVVERLAAAVKDNAFGVIETIDLQAKMAEKGVAFKHPCVILEVCNPKQAKAVLQEDMRVSTALPCRISIYQQGGKVHVATIRPTAMLSMFQGNATMNRVAAEVEAALIRIIDAACK